MTAPRLDDGLRLNPDAAHPPFAWRISLPAAWALLDTHPATWSRSLQRLIDDRLAGQRLSAASRRDVANQLEDLVVSAQHGGVLISLVHIGPSPSGGVASAGLHLAWYDSSPDPASLATARQAAGRQGVVEEVATDAGPVVLQRDHVMVAAPGSSTRHGLTSWQAFRPLTGRTWTALVATASAHPENTDALRELVIAVAGSIHAVDADGGDAPAASPADTGTPAGYAPIEAPPAPGVERGFGTMVTRRVEPDGQVTAPDQPDPS